MDSGQNAINGGNAQGIYSGANASGDVVLTPSGGLSNPKKRRGPLIIAIILIIIAIGAGVGAWIASQPRGGGGDNQGEQTAIDGGLREAFYGDDSGWAKYFTEKNKRLADLYEKSEDEELRNLINEQQRLLLMLDVEKQRSAFDVNKMLEAYVNGDFRSKKESVQSDIRGLDTDNGYIEQYVGLAEEVIVLISEMMNIYSEAGCDNNTVEDLQKCELSGQYGIDYSEIVSEYIGLTNSANRLINSAIQYYEDLDSTILSSDGEEDENDA